MEIIDVRKIDVKYSDKLVLADISFKVEEGDYISIVGCNGSGKSTLLKSVLGLVNLKSGKITFAKTYTKKDIGYIPQSHNLKKDFPASVLEVVISGMVGNKFFITEKVREKAISSLKNIGIEYLKFRSFSELSGGERQRVLLARALAGNKKILIMDEPTAGFDPHMASHFYELINKLNKEKNITIITTSHDIHSVIKYANKVVHLEKKLLYFGSINEYLKTDVSRLVLGGDCDECN